MGVWYLRTLRDALERQEEASKDRWSEKESLRILSRTPETLAQGS